MSIKINGKNLLKGQINGKEIQKIVINGNTVYELAPKEPAKNLYQTSSTYSSAWPATINLSSYSNSQSIITFAVYDFTPSFVSSVTITGNSVNPTEVSNFSGVYYHTNVSGNTQLSFSGSSSVNSNSYKWLGWILFDGVFKNAPVQLYTKSSSSSDSYTLNYVKDKYYLIVGTKKGDGSYGSTPTAPFTMSSTPTTILNTTQKGSSGTSVPIYKVVFFKASADGTTTISHSGGTGSTSCKIKVIEIDPQT